MRTCVAIGSLLIAVLAGAGNSTAADPVAAPARQPVPDQKAQDEALTLIRDVYKAEWAAAKTPAQKKAFAQKLAQVAATTESDVAGKFVLLRVARDMAAQIGEIELALEMIDDLDKSYEIKVSTARLEVFGLALKGSLSAAQQAALARAALETVDLAVDTDDYDKAKQLCEIAVTASKKSQDAALVKQAPLRAKEIDSLIQGFAELAAAQKALAANPVDPTANLVVGKFNCLLKQDWKGGLAYLAIGSDQKLQALAQSELQAGETAAEKLKVADAWWNWAEQERDLNREAARRHAGDWYQSALPDLNGLARVRIEKRVEELGPVPTRTAVAKTSSTAKPAAGGTRTPTAPQPGQVVTNSIGMKLAYIPPGEFKMGSPPTEEGRRSEEKLHPVKLTKGFYMGVTEVTQSEWKRVMENEPWKGKPDVQEGADNPATNIAWEEMKQFCKRLTEFERRNSKRKLPGEYTLPSEAQWEYACRAGTTTAFSIGDDPARLGEYAWYEPNAISRGERYAHRVAQKKPNAWGLYDMHGNVWEWVADGYHEYGDAAIDPVGSHPAINCIVRGGCWVDRPPFLRSALRFRVDSRNAQAWNGFRASLTIDDDVSSPAR